MALAFGSAKQITSSQDCIVALHLVPFQVQPSNGGTASSWKSCHYELTNPQPTLMVQCAIKNTHRDSGALGLHASRNPLDPH
eukprot:333746-Pelagomonas_calceolata.AAC.1